MGVPSSSHARLFYRCAFQRFDEAGILRRAEQRTIGCVYLAGYAIECMLKALVLSRLNKKGQDEMLHSFRGGKAHDFEWLRQQYYQNGGDRFPSGINRKFNLVSSWSTDLRYIPGKLTESEIDSFLAATEEILQWADRRL